MFSEVKVTEIYCMAGDSCKEFTRQQENIWLKTNISNIATSTTV